MTKVLARNAWQLTTPGGDEYVHNERMIRKCARGMSARSPGRYVCRTYGSEGTAFASRQYLYVYENGTIIEKGKVPAWVRDLGKTLGEVLR